MVKVPWYLGGGTYTILIERGTLTANSSDIIEWVDEQGFVREQIVTTHVAYREQTSGQRREIMLPTFVLKGLYNGDQVEVVWSIKDRNGQAIFVSNGRDGWPLHDPVHISPWTGLLVWFMGLFTIGPIAGLGAYLGLAWLAKQPASATPFDPNTLLWLSLLAFPTAWIGVPGLIAVRWWLARETYGQKIRRLAGIRTKKRRGKS